MNFIPPIDRSVLAMSPELAEAGGGADPDRKARLKEACVEFESIMTSMIIKDGLRGASEIGGKDEEESDNGCEAFRDFANEQLAYHVGRQGVMGVGDMLYRQLASRLEGEAPKAPRGG